MTEQEAAMNRAYANALYRQRKAAEQAYNAAVWGGALAELKQELRRLGDEATITKIETLTGRELEDALTDALLAVDHVPAACIHLRARARHE